jgi:hypothetical protein
LRADGPRGAPFARGSLRPPGSLRTSCSLGSSGSLGAGRALGPAHAPRNARLVLAALLVCLDNRQMATFADAPVDFAFTAARSGGGKSNSTDRHEQRHTRHHRRVMRPGPDTAIHLADTCRARVASRRLFMSLAPLRTVSQTQNHCHPPVWCSRAYSPGGLLTPRIPVNREGVARKDQFALRGAVGHRYKSTISSGTWPRSPVNRGDKRVSGVPQEALRCVTCCAR